MPEFEGILIHQRNNEEALPFFAFATTASQILEFAAIERTADTPGAAQRLQNAAHIRTIRAYLEASQVNIIPTAVTIAIKPNAFEVLDHVDGQNICFTKLRVSISENQEKPGLVIDGQHRILAFDGVEEEPPLLVCAILGADELECAMHFVVINNKTKRVPADLVRGIMAELGPEQQSILKERLTRVGISLGNYASALEILGSEDDSPFKDLLDWDINRGGTRRIKPAAVESSLRTILADLKTTVDVEVDDAIQILEAMWRGVRDSWRLDGISWIANNDDETLHSKLVDKASLVAVTEFLVQRMNLMAEEGLDVTDLDAVQSYCKRVMERIPSRFWAMHWNQKQLDTSSGRGLIRQSLASIRTAVSSNADAPLEEAILVSQAE